MLEFKELAVRYEGAKQQLKIGNQTLQRGRCLVLSGRSGSGKTTVTRILNGLLPELFPAEVSGTVRIGSFVWPQTSAADLSQTVGSVFQNPQTQFFLPDVISELTFGCENQGIAPAEIERRLEETLDLFDLRELSQRPIATCSGGQKQRIAFATAYMNQPDLMVLDEPTSQLDPSSIQLIRQLLLRLKEKGTTLVIAEHRLHYLLELFDELWVFEQGELCATYPAEVVKKWQTEDFRKRGLRPLRLTYQIEQTIEFPKEPNSEHTRFEKLRFRPSRRSPFEVTLSGSFQQQEIVAVLGENGAGKSTLIRGLAGLLPAKGKPKIATATDGARAWSKSQRLAESFVVMQDVHYQLFAPTVAEELDLQCHVESTERERIVHLLELEALLDRHPQTLSGGEKQRVAIATALCSGKKWLFFDEPTSGLDAENMERLHQLLRSFRDAGYYVWVITHDPECYLRLADRFLIYQAGHCQHDLARHDGTAAQYFSQRSN